MKFVSYLFCFMAIIAFALPSFAKGSNVAYVELERAMNETNEGKAEYTKLKADFDKKQKQLDKRAEKLKKMQADFEKSSMLITGDAKMMKMQTLQKELVEAQQLAMKLQKDLFNKEMAVKDKLLGKMIKIIEKLAKKNGYTMVLEKKESGILYAPQSNNITNELIRIYNKKYPYKKK